eukprot:SAG31_NODE_2294_length_5991_cov_2.589613_4_plen_141_part_00
MPRREGTDLILERYHDDDFDTILGPTRQRAGSGPGGSRVLDGLVCAGEDDEVVAEAQEVAPGTLRRLRDFLSEAVVVEAILRWAVTRAGRGWTWHGMRECKAESTSANQSGQERRDRSGGGGVGARAPAPLGTRGTTRRR